MLNAWNNIFPGAEEVCCIPPITGRDVPTSGYYPGSRKPRPLAVDEYAIFWPACPDIRRGMSPHRGFD